MFCRLVKKIILKQYVNAQNYVLTQNSWMKNTHYAQTSLIPSLIILVAIGAWPCPSESAWNLLVILQASASCSKPEVGSTPGESTNMSGVRVVESSKTAFMSRTGGSTNLNEWFKTQYDLKYGKWINKLDMVVKRSSWSVDHHVIWRDKGYLLLRTKYSFILLQ